MAAADVTATEVPAAVRRLVQDMPKAELHLHLDGSLKPIAAIELAQQHGIDAPRTYDAMFDVLTAPVQAPSQAELLRAFDLPLRILQWPDALERVTRELVEDKAADRVKFFEIKWAPALHCEQGMSVDEVIEVVADAARAAAVRCGVEARLCVVGFRAHTPERNVEVAEAAVRFRHHGVTGWDLAGYEAAHPDPTPHAEAFAVARAGGLGTTVHVGEVVDDGSLVRRALTLHTDRISHGPWSVSAPDVVATLIERGVTLDLCPTSNMQASTVPTRADHPLPTLLRMGVPVTINTDDVTISDITLSEEWLHCIADLGITLPELWRCNLHALDVAFVDEPTRARLRDEFTTWAANVPELH